MRLCCGSREELRHVVLVGAHAVPVFAAKRLPKDRVHLAVGLHQHKRGVPRRGEERRAQVNDERLESDVRHTRMDQTRNKNHDAFAFQGIDKATTKASTYLVHNTAVVNGAREK